MANIFFNLPAPSGNGTGAPVDVSTMGAIKTITVGDLGRFTLNVEFSNEAAPTKYAPAATFFPGGPSQYTISIAARWMRVRVSGYQSGGPANVDVGGTDDGASFANLAVTAGNGTAAATDVTALGLFKTVQIGGPFRGTTIIEVSEDNTSWSEIMTFYAPGAQSKIFAASHMRVTRENVPVVQPGTPIVNVGATELGGGGGGGGSGNPQAFTYEVDGTEPDPTEIEIALPSARSSATYLVFPSQQTATNILGMAIDDISKSTTQFTLSLSGAASTSDIFAFYVVDEIT